MILGVGVLAFALRAIVPRPPIAALDLDGRLALLPLVNSTGDRADFWVEEGLTELAAEALRRTPGVGMVPLARLRREVVARGLDGTDGASRERLRRLALAAGADLVVEGEIRHASRGGAGAENNGQGIPYALSFRVFDADGQTAAGEVEGPTALAVADLLIFSLVRGLPNAGEPVRISRLFARDPFLDRLYAMGLVKLSAVGAAAARPFFEIALEGRPYFLQAKLALLECARREGDLAQARALAYEVLEEAEARGEAHLRARTLEELGLLAALEGNVKAAEDYYQQAAAAYNRLEDESALAEVLGEAARLALGGGDRASAAGLFEEMLVLQDGLGDILGQIDSHIELGSLRLALAELESASEHLGVARDLARGLEDRFTEMRAVASLGEVAWREGELVLAEERWSEALAFYQQRDDGPRQLLLRQNLASFYLRRLRLEEAEEQLLEALAMATKLGNEPAEAHASLHLAWVMLKSGYPFQARPHLDRALALDRWLAEERVGLQRVIAWSAYEEGNYRLAVETQEQVREQGSPNSRSSDDAFLEVFHRSLEEGTRFPLPGEAGYG
jgi:tetratricopeptide (TPR) repeat protein